MSGSDKKISFEAIGFFHGQATEPYQAPRQPTSNQARAKTTNTLTANSAITAKTTISTKTESTNIANQISQANQAEYIQLENRFAEGLKNLEGFSRIWVIFLFHHNQNWKPLVRPPRGSLKKVGVFSSRSPYRPNPIGLSCVELIKIDKNKVYIGPNDLLRGTPILDLKPYIPEADSFPQSSIGWLTHAENEKYTIEVSSRAESQLTWLSLHQENQLAQFLFRQLEYFPLDSDRKRVCEVSENLYELAYRTWRILFSFKDLDQYPQSIWILEIKSGYTQTDLDEFLTNPDCNPYKDKSLHLKFISEFSKTS